MKDMLKGFIVGMIWMFIIILMTQLLCGCDSSPVIIHNVGTITKIYEDEDEDIKIIEVLYESNLVTNTQYFICSKQGGMYALNTFIGKAVKKKYYHPMEKTQ
jgi:hypothetical protein